MSKPFQVALLRSSWPNCTFEVPPCVIPTGNSEVVEINNLIIQFLQPEGYNLSDIRFIPAVRYDANRTSPEFPKSIMGMIEYGTVEMTDYILSLNYDRSLHLDHAGDIFHMENAFVYKKPDNEQIDLDLFTFLPWKLYMFALMMFVGFYCLPRIIKSIKPLTNRVSPVVGILASLFLGYLSSNVVLLFSIKLPKPVLFNSFESMVDLMEAGKLRMVTAHYLLEVNLLNFETGNCVM